MTWMHYLSTSEHTRQIQRTTTKVATDAFHVTIICATAVQVVDRPQRRPVQRVHTQCHGQSRDEDAHTQRPRFNGRYTVPGDGSTASCSLTSALRLPSPAACGTPPPQWTPADPFAGPARRISCPGESPRKQSTMQQSELERNSDASKETDRCMSYSGLILGSLRSPRFDAALKRYCCTFFTISTKSGNVPGMDGSPCEASRRSGSINGKSDHRLR